jgi:hypothetical protein
MERHQLCRRQVRGQAQRLHFGQRFTGFRSFLHSEGAEIFIALGLMKRTSPKASEVCGSGL